MYRVYRAYLPSREAAEWRHAAMSLCSCAPAGSAARVALGTSGNTVSPPEPDVASLSE